MYSLYIYGTILAGLIGLILWSRAKAAQNEVLRRQIEIEKGNAQAAIRQHESLVRQHAEVSKAVEALRQKQRAEQKQIEAGERNHFDTEEF